MNQKAKGRRKLNSSDRLRKVQLSFYAEPEDYATLKALSARTDVPQQVYLRRGLTHILHINDATQVMSAVERTREQFWQASAFHADAVTSWRALREQTLKRLERSAADVVHADKGDDAVASAA